MLSSSTASRGIMGNILAVVTSKGGGGKTTLTTCLAVSLAERGFRIAVIDADRNGTFSDWHQSNYEGPPLTSSAEIRHAEVIDLAQSHADTHDVVLVDTAGFENLTAAAAISTADFVLIPCMADRGSIREAMKTAKQTDSFAKAARRAIPYRVIFSQWNPRGLAEHATIADLAAAGVPVMTHFIPDLAAYRQLTFTGRVPSTGKIGSQMDRVLAELVTLEAITALTAFHAKDASSDIPSLIDLET